MVLVEGKVHAEEREETEEEADHPITAEGTPSAETTIEQLDIEPDVEDLTGIEEREQAPDEEREIFEAWVDVRSRPTDLQSKKVHKATMLRLYSSPLATLDSKDRLKRVRGYSRFNDSKSLDELAQLTDSTTGPSLDVEDPAVTLVRCNDRTFLAVIQVTGIRQNNASVLSLPVAHLHEPNISIQCQIMKLAPRELTENTEGADWEWIGNYKSGSHFQTEGRWMDVIDLLLCKASRGRNVGKDTYVFQTAELRSMAALLHERVDEEFRRLPVVRLSDSYPYRVNGGELNSNYAILQPSYPGHRSLLCL